MIDHMTFRVKDIARTKTFYSAALAPLGYELAYEAEHEGSRMLSYAYADARVPDGNNIEAACHLPV